MKKLSHIIQNLETLLNSILGYIYRYLVDARILQISSLQASKNKADIIVSLTSYGRRVSSNVVYYTLVSILRQTVKPERIILWLSNEEWNEEKLPKKLKKLRDFGVEIEYCEDYLSYKKLVPTLIRFPNRKIITFDDDNIYRKKTIEKLVNASIDYPNCIICLHALSPVLINGIPSNYRSWKKPKYLTISQNIFPVGWAGILYPPKSLHANVLKPYLFLEECKYADDIWFWICGMMNNTEKVFIGKDYSVLSFDILYQLLHKGSALTHANSGKNRNDEYLKILYPKYIMNRE